MGTFFRYKGKLFNFSREAEKVEFGTVQVEESLEEMRAELVKAMRYGTTFVIDLWKSCPNFKTQFTNKEILDTEIVFNCAEFKKRDNYIKFVKEEEMYGPGGMNNVFYANDDFSIVLLTSLKQQEDIDKLVQGIPHADKWKKIVIT